jgi:hypothetical protein
LRTLLAVLNQRDAKATQTRLDEIAKVLSDAIEFDRLMFGGSVAKHTFVDGLSDVDALVVLDAASYADKTPSQVLGSMQRRLRNELSSSIWQDIRKGEMAITVVLRDGSEVQLVPAMQSGKTMKVPERGTSGWVSTDPKAFQSQLTQSNAKLGGTLVPAIKLVKSAIGNFPDQKRIGGYHVEALAVEAAKSFTGPNTVKAVVTHIFKYGAARVLSPIGDVTGQSTSIDSGLGSAHSNQRRVVADAMAAVGRRLDAASSVEQWKAVLE